MAWAESIMVLHVKLFAGARELAGAEQIPLELPLGATIADAKHLIAQSYPQLAGLIARSVIARNQEYAQDEDAIQADDELAVIPPVSGG